MKKQNKIALLLIFMFLIVSCASVPLTPDQSARSAISKAQGQWIVWFDVTQTYYLAHPEKHREYQDKVIPAFQAAKDGLKDVSDTLQSGKSDTLSIIIAIDNITNRLLNLLIQLEVLK